MEDKALRKGLSVTAILLIAVLAFLISFNNANGLVYGEEVKLYCFNRARTPLHQH